MSANDFIQKVLTELPVSSILDRLRTWNAADFAKDLLEELETQTDEWEREGISPDRWGYVWALTDEQPRMLYIHTVLTGPFFVIQFPTRTGYEADDLQTLVFSAAGQVYWSYDRPIQEGSFAGVDKEGVSGG